jgi:L-fucose isomerase
MKNSPDNNALKVNPPVNCLVGDMPKVGIRPTIDGRLQGVRESLEKTTMVMAKNAAKLISSTCGFAAFLTVH